MASFGIRKSGRAGSGFLAPGCSAVGGGPRSWPPLAQDLRPSAVHRIRKRVRSRATARRVPGRIPAPSRTRAGCRSRSKTLATVTRSPGLASSSGLSPRSRRARRRIHARRYCRAGRRRRAQFLDQLLLEIGGDGVFELLGLVVDLVPLESENLGQHPLDQVVAVEQPAGDFASRPVSVICPLRRLRSDRRVSAA